MPFPLCNYFIEGVEEEESILRPHGLHREKISPLEARTLSKNVFFFFLGELW